MCNVFDYLHQLWSPVNIKKKKNPVEFSKNDLYTTTFNFSTMISVQKYPKILFKLLENLVKSLLQISITLIINKKGNTEFIISNDKFYSQIA